MTDLNRTAFPKCNDRLVEDIDTLVVGAGQAGVAMSEHLSKLGVPHLVLERNRIAEAWRTGRWDSLVANGPVWHDRFPGLEFDLDPDAFAPKEQVAAYFEAYARKFNAPIRTGVEVKRVVRNADRPGFTVETSEGVIRANRVVAATGPFQRPVIPPIAPNDTALTQLHSAAYRNPQQLPAGAVLVVGAGSSGVQIADELQRSGRQVYLSVGAHDRPPRSYRGRDFCWWLGVLGLWDMEAAQPGKEHVTIAVSGARGGQTIDFRGLAEQGLTLVGLTKAFSNGVVSFQADLADNLARGDENYLELLDAADAYIARNGLDLPEEPEARRKFPDPDCVTHPLLELDLAAAGVTSIIWATGYAVDFSWLQVGAFDANGKPQHQRGVSSEPGVYFLGLPWLSRRGSTFIWGVWHDAKHIADHIATQHKYLAYRDAAQRQAAAQDARAEAAVPKLSILGAS
ncbi:NAD(P)-binding domain-containing protein [Pseudomonas sp. UL073]|uniref:NAD(P)-binding domain-containing protein n=1 Tax=Zestomonas insulae TaxID=2809017 RepID=A0ABS2IAU8_9GAMM|nr:NAD(P)/FAD-dependent oxidoreductase [Pseudomonas insulae]MBM7060244.1 NAD(P)-binding domain-containing protein [Pseudomonas insulae]